MHVTDITSPVSRAVVPVLK